MYREPVGQDILKRKCIISRTTLLWKKEPESSWKLLHVVLSEIGTENLKSRMTSTHSKHSKHMTLQTWAQRVCHKERPSTGILGVGTGHQWGVESTMWDYQNNKSFRGMTCPCGARLKVTSRAYGQGRKKKERSFTVEGPSCCPMFTEELDARFQGVDPITGVLRWKQKWRGMVGTWTKWDEIGCSVLQTKNLVTWSSSLYRLIVRVRAVIHFLSPWPFGILHLNERGVSCWVDAVAVLVKLASAEEERHKHETNQTKRGSPRKIDVQSQISMFNELGWVCWSSPILGKQEKRREHVGFLQSRHLWSHGAIEPEVRGNCHLWSLIRLTVVTGYNGYNGYNQNFQPKLSGLSRLFRKFSSKVTTRSRTHRKMG